MKKKKLYFENEDATLCEPLDVHLNEAREEGLEQIKLFESVVPKNPEYRFCNLAGYCIEKEDCNKEYCGNWTKGNGNLCTHRGIYREFGESFVFDVNSGKVIKQSSQKCGI